MMTAMARLPCKSTSTQQQPPFRQSNNTNGNNNRNYWDMQIQPSVPSAYTRTQHRHVIDHTAFLFITGKRKSAVELLQESKAFYVKSEIVLDRKQELKNSGHLQVARSINTSTTPRLLRQCKNSTSCTLNLQQQPQAQVSLPPPPAAVAAATAAATQQQQQQQQQQQHHHHHYHHHHHLAMICGGSGCGSSSVDCCCHSISTCGDRGDGVLSPQRTLPPALPPKSPRLISAPQRRAIMTAPQSAVAGDQLQAKLRKLLNTDSKENIHFTDTPGSPNSHGVRDSSSSTNATTLPLKSITSPSMASSPLPSPTAQLSPPSAQANLEIRLKFGRSHSHSHTSTKINDKSNSGVSSPPTICQTTTCHKSLPDLHTTARTRTSLSSSKPIHINYSDNCPDCETSSDYSDHSFKRDSVCYRSSRHIRRSLGSSGGNDTSSILSSGGRTHKSSGSSKISHGATARDSGGSSGHCTHRSEPPPRMQECWGHIRRDSGASTQHSNEKYRFRRGNSHASAPNENPSAMLTSFNCHDDSDSSNSPIDYSPTCNSRLSDGWKEGRARPILRSKSDISDRYWRYDNNDRSYERNKKQKQQLQQQQQQQQLPPPPPPQQSRPLKSGIELENFFDRLGLDSDNYQYVTVPTSNSSSPVFFDSVSSVDSALGLYPWSGNNQTSTNNEGHWQANNCNAGNDETSQRVSDPPSIVEKNARIIKWLCQCRKIQFSYS